MGCEFAEEALRQAIASAKAGSLETGKEEKVWVRCTKPGCPMRFEAKAIDGVVFGSGIESGFPCIATGGRINDPLKS